MHEAAVCRGVGGIPPMSRHSVRDSLRENTSEITPLGAALGAKISLMIRPANILVSVYFVACL